MRSRNVGRPLEALQAASTSGRSSVPGCRPSRFVIPSMVLVIALGGCSHTFYQFRLDAREMDAVTRAKDSLAVAAGADVRALGEVVDLSGRRGVEALVAGMTLERTAGDEQVERLTRALYLGLMGDQENPADAFDQDLAALAGRMGQRVASAGLRQAGLGGLAAMVGAAGPSDQTQLRQMQASLNRHRVSSCVGLAPIVSYDAGLLGHIHSQLADQDPDYVAWRSRVRSIHLVRFTCESRHGVFLMSREEGRAEVAVLGWQFFTDAQWTALQPRMREALDLPREG